MNNFLNIIVEDIADEDLDDNIVANVAGPIIDPLPGVIQLAGAAVLAADGDVDYLFVNERNNVVYNLHWFAMIVPAYNNDQFKSHFRMNRTTYMELERIIRPYLCNVENENSDENENNDEIGDEEESNDEVEDEAVNNNEVVDEAEVDAVLLLRKKILLTIWILSTPDSFRSVADRFGLSKVMCHHYFKQVLVVLKELVQTYVVWPHPNDYAEIEAIFSERSGGFPGVVGAVDGTHINIKQPPHNANDYYNRHHNHSIILQGTCDHSGKFIDVSIGRPGRVHDSTVLRNSNLFAALTGPNPLLPPNKHILADSGYFLHQNIMTPFRDNGFLNDAKRNYNTRHASIRSIIERAFGFLKGKFRRLKYLDVQSVEMAKFITAASCMLHNFLIMHGEFSLRNNINFDDDSEEDDDDENIDDDDDFEADPNAVQKRRDIVTLLL